MTRPRDGDLDALRALLRLPPDFWSTDAPPAPLPDEVRQFVRRATRPELQALLVLTVRRLQSLRRRS